MGRRRRWVPGAAALLCGALLAWPTGATAAAPHRHVRPPTLPAVESGLLPWQLPAPVSREALVPGAGTAVTLLGGLETNGASSNAVFTLQTTNGSLLPLGTLPVPVHDGAAGVVGGRDVVFGGGDPATDGIVEGIGATGSGPSQSGHLPAPRSDDAVLSIGRVTYVVGGYDGSGPDPQVLATTDGSTFTTTAALQVPVRYPAVAPDGKDILVFGGESIPSAGPGVPVDDVQRVDPMTHTSTVVAHLPEPLEGASAVVLGGVIYLFGGDTTSPSSSVPGVGTTQLSGQQGSTATQGTGDDPTNDTIWAFDIRRHTAHVAGRLQVPVAYAAATVVGATAWIVGGESNGSPVAAVQMLRTNRAFGTAGAPGAGSPYFGDKLLIADRGNNRLLVLDDTMRVIWTYPTAATAGSAPAFYFPDDAFFVRQGTVILSNQEDNQTIIALSYPGGRIVWEYGHPRQPGSAPGYLRQPDDAYLLKDGDVSVADDANCRVLILTPTARVAHQIGTTGRCVHDPPTGVGSPNGDTPLADGNLLVSEINGSWIDEYTTSGSLVWTVHLPVVAYPSDPQQVGPDRYLVADFSSPGQLVEFDRTGSVFFRYDVGSGPGELNHPSLAELLPSGVIMLNDDHNDRMVAIDPVTSALVWQYGTTGTAGTTAGMLNAPDGFDLLAPNGSTPTHPATG